MIKIITNKWFYNHVSLDTVTEFENVILSATKHSKIVTEGSGFLLKIAFKFYHLAKKLKIVSLFIPDKKTTSQNDQVYFAILMGTDLRFCLPYFFFRARKNIYIFDAWKNTHRTIIEFVNDFKVDHLFVSSSDAVKHLNKYKTNCHIHWVPEGINLDKYKFMPPGKKYIDVIQIGRKYDEYHNRIAGKLNSSNRTYLFEKIKGELIFATREEFINGLAASKISICFPSNITHPERAEGIETMTVRYLQSIASKCLIVGKAPEEMIQLFGYNPVIEADLTDPAEQLENILNNFTKYVPLIEKNYSRIHEHQWSTRWGDIEKLIFD